MTQKAHISNSKNVDKCEEAKGNLAVKCLGGSHLIFQDKVEIFKSFKRK